MGLKRGLAVVTTAGPFPEALPLHVKNLCWALGDEITIYVHTYPHLAIPQLRHGPEIITINADPRSLRPREVYPFYNDSKTLRKIAEKHTLLFFMQQDLFLSEAMRFDAALMKNHSRVFQLLLYPYQYKLLDRDSPPRLKFSTKGRRFLQERLWEGGLAIPSELLLEALDQGVNLGFALGAFRPQSPLYRELVRKFPQLHISDQQGIVRPLKDFLDRATLKGVDTFLELSLFSFLKTWQVESPLALEKVPCEWEINSRSLHLHYTEKLMLLSERKIATHPEEILTAPLYMRRSRGEISLHYLLCGLWVADEFTASLLQSTRGYGRLKSKITELKRNAAEWMDADEFERLCWAERKMKKSRTRAAVGNTLSRFFPGSMA